MQHIVSYKPFVGTVGRYAVCGLADEPAKKPTNAVASVGQSMMGLNYFVEGQEGLRHPITEPTRQARLIG